MKKNLKDESDTIIKSEIVTMIERCKICIFVVGADTHNSPWIDFEARKAKELGLPIFLVRLPKEKGGPPKILKECLIYEWNSKSLKAELTKAFQLINRHKIK